MAGWREPLPDVATVASDSMDAVVWAIKQRRLGISVITQFSGNRKRQYKRAETLARSVVDIDQLERERGEMQRVEEELFAEVFDQNPAFGQTPAILRWIAT